MIGFERKKSYSDFLDLDNFGIVNEQLTSAQQERIKKIRQAWNFYEGYHWEDLPPQETAETTVNYCRAFVDKYVAFELGDAFTFTVHKNLENKVVTRDGRTLFEYLEDVWEDNNQYLLCTELGQSKSVTGDAWIQVDFTPASELDYDPFNEYPEGRLQLLLHPTHTIFAEYDPYDRKILRKLTVMFPYRKVNTNVLGRTTEKTALYKCVYTDKEIAVYDDTQNPTVYPNRYGIIPFIQIKNLPVANRTEGRGDLEDIIPMNTEYNLKKSDVSEVIDYHSSPITIVYGAKIGSLEKGANKMWGGIPKDARIENLEMKGDGGLSSSYTDDLKLSMCEIGGIPETCLGGAQAISNTSGVALSYINLPLVEKTKLKRQSTEDGLERLNKLILLVSLLEGIIKIPEGVSTRDFFRTEVDIPNTLPKDTLIELQQIQIEMQLGLEHREHAMKRLGRENIEAELEKIDKEREEHPEYYGGEKQQPQMNSGMTNGQTPIEEVRKEITGQNGGGTV